MALSPLSTPTDRITIVSPEVIPSRTYEFDFDSGEFTGSVIDGDSAIRQFIRKALVTARYRFLIYDKEYGSEMETLLGQDLTNELLENEIPRIVREALIYDERIADVFDISITKDPGDDKMFVSFSIATTDGTTISEEVTL
jgi:phage baseplate assembly protein W